MKRADYVCEEDHDDDHFHFPACRYVPQVVPFSPAAHDHPSASSLRSPEDGRAFFRYLSPAGCASPAAASPAPLLPPLMAAGHGLAGISHAAPPLRKEFSAEILQKFATGPSSSAQLEEEQSGVSPAAVRDSFLVRRPSGGQDSTTSSAPSNKIILDSSGGLMQQFAGEVERGAAFPPPSLAVENKLLEGQGVYTSMLFAPVRKCKEFLTGEGATIPLVFREPGPPLGVPHVVVPNEEKEVGKRCAVTAYVMRTARLHSWTQSGQLANRARGTSFELAEEVNRLLSSTSSCTGGGSLDAEEREQDEEINGDHQPNGPSTAPSAAGGGFNGEDEPVRGGEERTAGTTEGSWWELPLEVPSSSGGPQRQRSRLSSMGMDPDRESVCSDETAADRATEGCDSRRVSVGDCLPEDLPEGENDVESAGGVLVVPAQRSSWNLTVEGGSYDVDSSLKREDVEKQEEDPPVPPTIEEVDFPMPSSSACSSASFSAASVLDEVEVREYLLSSTLSWSASAAGGVRPLPDWTKTASTPPASEWNVSKPQIQSDTYVPHWNGHFVPSRRSSMVKNKSGEPALLATSSKSVRSSLFGAGTETSAARAAGDQKFQISVSSPTGYQLQDVGRTNSTTGVDPDLEVDLSRLSPNLCSSPRSCSSAGSRSYSGNNSRRGGYLPRNDTTPVEELDPDELQRRLFVVKEHELEEEAGGALAPPVLSTEDRAASFHLPPPRQDEQQQGLSSEQDGGNGDHVVGLLGSSSSSDGPALRVTDSSGAPGVPRANKALKPTPGQRVLPRFYEKVIVQVPDHQQGYFGHSIQLCVKTQNLFWDGMLLKIRNLTDKTLSKKFENAIVRAVVRIESCLVEPARRVSGVEGAVEGRLPDLISVPACDLEPELVQPARVSMVRIVFVVVWSECIFEGRESNEEGTSDSTRTFTLRLPPCPSH